MMKLLAELKRRQMFRVAAAYAVVAWLLLQIVNNVAPILDLPVWVARAFLLALVIGFPIALLFVWMRDLAPADAATPRPATTRLDYVLAGGLILVIGLVSYQQLASTPQASQQPAASQPAAGSIAVAVLPFANLSGDASQEFFSDGMTEEISAVLAKVQGLTVLGRSSAFQFKGQNSDPRDIGRALSATHLIEGSVRKAGERVRITAQLVRADNGAQLWSETYDRQLNDIFAIQEEIAEAITASLSVPLGLSQGDRLVRDRTEDLESYDQYLRAKVLLRARGNDVARAIAMLEQVVARDPAFAPAWAELGQAYVTLPDFSPLPGSSVQSYYAKAEMASRQAIRLDSRNALAHAALARVQAQAGKYTAAEDLYGQALALDPSEPDALFNFTLFLVRVGRFREAVGASQKLETLEPFVPNYNITHARAMIVSGQIEAAIAILEPIPAEAAGGFFRNLDLAQAYAAQARYADAADTLLAIPQPNAVSRQLVEDAARLLRTAPAKINAPRELPALEVLSFVYAYIGAEDRLMEYPEQVAPAIVNRIWFSAYATARKTERFKAYARNVGFVDYWRARGWPDLCRPISTDDFVCD